MEYTTVEVTKIEAAAEASKEAQMAELTDLQLSFVGGGSGEVVFN